MTSTCLHFLKWGPASGCSPTPFTSLTFTPTPSILSNLTGGRTEAVKVLWAGRVDALVIPPQIGYLAEFQEWDTLLLVEYLAGASLQPEDLAGAVAKDRYWLELVLDQVVGPAGASSWSRADDMDVHHPSGPAQLLASSKSRALSDQLSQWLARETASSLHAVSLLRFNPGSSCKVPQLAAAAAPEIGPGIMCSAKVVRQGGEDSADWDAVTIVSYPNRTAFRESILSDSDRKHCSDVADMALFAVVRTDNAAAKL